MNFIKPKIGETKLCARVYEDNRFARCIMFKSSDNKTSEKNYLIIALEDINHNGGLSKYEWYNAGLNSYKYRNLNNLEIYSLPYLTEKLSQKDTEQIRRIKNDFCIDLKKLIDIKKLRKEKLQKIKNLSIKDEIL